MFLNAKNGSPSSSIVDQFAHEFGRIFIASSDRPVESAFSNHQCVQLIEVNEFDILNSIDELVNKTTAGDDQIPAFLKDCTFKFFKPSS